MSENEVYHTSVMLEECMNALEINPDGSYVDVTFGGGGHSHAILQCLSPKGRLYSFDQDADAIKNIKSDDRLIFTAGNFRYLDRFMDYYDRLGQIDGILADLGVSGHHFDDASRGFSFRSEDPLVDMRMNARGGNSARDILNDYEEEALAHVFYTYGELKNSRKLAAAIVRRRTSQSLNTVGDLIAAVKPEINPREEKKQLTCIFQALRIEVNDELSALEEMLRATTDVLKPGGLLAVMTYHSLEDRIVKQFLKSSPETDRPDIYGKAPSLWQPVTRKPIVPSTEEIARNPRSRSAKLRVARWTGTAKNDRI